MLKDWKCNNNRIVNLNYQNQHVVPIQKRQQKIMLNRIYHTGMWELLRNINYIPLFILRELINHRPSSVVIVIKTTIMIITYNSKLPALRIVK